MIFEFFYARIIFSDAVFEWSITTHTPNFKTQTITHTTNKLYSPGIGLVLHL